MDAYERIDRALQREIEIADEELADGRIDISTYNLIVRRLEREARQELRDAERNEY
jgi:hypothetical protein